MTITKFKLYDKVQILPDWNWLAEQYHNKVGTITRIVIEPNESFKNGHYIVTLKDGNIVSCGHDLFESV